MMTGGAVTARIACGMTARLSARLGARRVSAESGPATTSAGRCVSSLSSRIGKDEDCTATFLAQRDLSMGKNARSTSSVARPSGSDDYESPFADFFQAIADGKTTLGTDSKNPIEEVPTQILKCGIPENVLRFRTVSYGRMLIEPHVQPDEHKVTLKVGVHHIPLESDLEREIFHQIVGRRFVQEKHELRLTSDQFASRIENKRHLVSMLDRIVHSTKRLAKEAGG